MSLWSPATRFGLRLPYLTLRTRFLISVFVGLSWAAFSTWLALPWIADLGDAITLPLAIAVIVGIAIFPGYLNAFLVSSLLLDRAQSLGQGGPGPVKHSWPGVTLLIAAFDEADDIEETLRYATSSIYPGRLRLVVVDDGSTDRTAKVVERFAASDPRISLVRKPHGGKATALNAGLATCRTKLVATIDADTLLMKHSLKRLVTRMLRSPEGTAAVAGAVMARNSRKNWLTKMQEWDYQLGIASIKRSQALWQATLVSQGSFSLFRAKDVRAVGGWPQSVGEDIVMTWALLANGMAASFEPTAVAFTHVPERIRDLARQRSRWARGMIDGLRANGLAILRRHQMSAHGIAVNCAFPWMDACYTFAFLPGVVLALTGNFMIVGPLTIAVLPLSILLSLLMLSMQRKVFSEVKLRVRRNPLGYVLYLLAYQPMMSPFAVVGYARAFLGRPPTW